MTDPNWKGLRKDQTPRFLVLNLAGIALLFVAYAHGWVDTVIEGDPTLMTETIAAMFLAGIVALVLGHARLAAWIAPALVYVGLIGTIVGISLVFVGIDPESAGDVTAVVPLVARLIQGIGIALYTTLLGSVGYLWLSLNVHLFGDDE
jgi:peptidoglycan/LPS O-acetylase OafA/YrhL